MRLMTTLLTSLTLTLSAACAQAEGPYAAPGQYNVETRLETWHDLARGRDLPIKLYLPERADIAPVVIFSHGLGGDREGARYLGEHLASWGFVAVFVQHPGSDVDVWRGLQGRDTIMRALAAASADPQTAISRFLDIPYVIDEIERRAETGDLSVDPQHIGLVGHSFGAHTVMAAAGFTFLGQAEPVRMNEDRLSAAVALSPPPPPRQLSQARFPEAYGQIDIPILHMTGTEDSQPFDDSIAARERLIPFEQINDAPQYLVVFDGGDHGVFSGRESRRETPDWYPAVQADTAEITTAFFLAYLAGDAGAMAILNGDGFAAMPDVPARTARRGMPTPQLAE